MTITLPFHVGSADHAQEIVFESLACISHASQPQMRFTSTNAERDWAIGLDTADQDASGRPLMKGLFVGGCYKFTVRDAGFNTLNNQLHSSLAFFNILAEGCPIEGPGITKGTFISKVISSGTVQLDNLTSYLIDPSAFSGVVTFCPLNKSVNDLLYLNPHGFGPMSIGLGAPQSNESFRVHVLSDPNFPAQGSLRIGTNKGQVGPALVVGQVNTPSAVFSVDVDGTVKATGFVTAEGRRGMSGTINTGKVILELSQGLIVGVTPAEG